MREPPLPWPLMKEVLISDRSLREYAESKFKRSGVNVQGSSKIKAVGPDWLDLEGEGKGGSFTVLEIHCESSSHRASALRASCLVDRSLPEPFHR